MLQLYPVYLLWNRRKTLTGSPDPMCMQTVQINLQLYPVYLLWNRRKTLTGSPDPTRANGTNKPCMYSLWNRRKTLTGSPDPTRMQTVQINLQLYPVYLLWNRRKTLTGSPDPTHMQTVQINLACIRCGIDVRPSQDHRILRMQTVQINLQLYPVYLLWNRRKTLTGSPDPTRANGTNKPSIVSSVFVVE